MSNVIFHIVTSLLIIFLFMVFGVTFMKQLENYQDADPEDKTKEARLLLMTPWLTIKNIIWIGQSVYTFIKNILGFTK